MKTRILKNTLSALFFMLSIHALAQGPPLSFFYNRATELPWASCRIRLDNGSTHKIGFFPVINEKTNCPMGIENYSKTIDLDEPLVFLNINLTEKFETKSNTTMKDKIVMLTDYLDESSDVESGFLEEKIRYAIDNNAAGVVILAEKKRYPLYIVNTDKEIPVISITFENALTIFETAGLDLYEIAERNRELNFPVPVELPANLNLRIEGRFGGHETTNFNYKYLPGTLTEEELNRQMIINEKSVGFLLKLFKELDFKWDKENIFYFNSYDSKVFFTGYWGIGFSCDGGVYNVFFKNDSAFRLSVHENTHSLLRKNSLTFSSFFDEGIARYAEAMAADKNLNRRKTIEFLNAGKLFPLADMLEFNIGDNPEETEMGYPAAGSFVEFLVDKYGLKIIFRLSEKTSEPIFRNTLINQEKEWINWLNENFESE